MKTIQTIDEQGRTYKINYYTNEKAGQYTSHGLSYLGARKQYEDMGLTMGLERLIK